MILKRIFSVSPNSKINFIYLIVVSFAILALNVGCSKSPPAESLSIHEPDIESLINTMYSSDNTNQRIKAAVALETLGEKDKNIVPKLLKQYKDAKEAYDYKRANATMKALALVGAYNIEPIIEYANQVDLDKRENIIFVLRLIGDNRAIPFLIECLKSDNSIIRYDALLAVCDLPDERAFEPVLALLNDKNENIRLQAIDALCAMHDYRALQPLKDMYAQKPKGDFQSMLIGALGVFQTREYVEEFIKLDKSLKKDDYLHETIAETLGELGDARALDILSEGLLDNKIPSHERLRYAIALNKIPDTRKSEAAYRVWKDKKEDINGSDIRLRIYAAIIVADSCSPYSLEAARWVLEHGGTPQKVAIIKILGKKLYRQTAILRLLEFAAKDSDEYVRNAAKYEISKFDYDEL
jgi:HEAT repeat protein